MKYFVNISLRGGGYFCSQLYLLLWVGCLSVTSSSSHDPSPLLYVAELAIGPTVSDLWGVEGEQGARIVTLNDEHNIWAGADVTVNLLEVSHDWTLCWIRAWIWGDECHKRQERAKGGDLWEIVRIVYKNYNNWVHFLCTKCLTICFTEHWNTNTEPTTGVHLSSVIQTKENKLMACPNSSTH